jgi:hypothetical protein
MTAVGRIDRWSARTRFALSQRTEPGPSDPIGQYGRRHVRRLSEQLAHRGSIGVNDVGAGRR